MQSGLSALESKFQTRLEEGSNSGASQPDLPPSDSLPDFDTQNPWRSARYAPCADGMLTIEGLGTRPLSDFERFPAEEGVPLSSCYVRLSAEVSVRDDRVPKETVLLPREKAQSCLRREMREAGCINTTLLPCKGNLTMFTMGEEMPNPFSTKTLEAVLAAVAQGKTSVSLREEEFTSFLFPGDSEVWEDVALTFSTGKLSADCASQQFHETLPKLPEKLISAEFAARSRLARTLHSMLVTELLMFCHPDMDTFPLLAKSMVCSLRHDLMDFAMARRACRKHVLEPATLRHEPIRLIDGPIWGADLFPRHLVSECIDGAVQAHENLQTRWKISFQKRKAQEGPGHQSRGQGRKRSRFNRQHRMQRLNQQQLQGQQAYMVPVTPQTQPPQGTQGYQMMAMPCLLYTSPSPRDGLLSRMPSSA